MIVHGDTRRKRWLPWLEDRERGANVVEFAVIAPLLVILLFGIMEASWAFSQQLEIRHGAREGARLAATDYGDLDAIATETCGRMDHTPGGASVTLAKTGADIGDSVTVTVSAPMSSLTNFMDWAFAGVIIDSTAEMRIEQVATWADGTRACP